MVPIALDSIDLHLCLPGLLTVAFERFAAFERAGLAAAGIRFAAESRALPATAAGSGRLVVVDPTLWRPARFRALETPTDAQVRVCLWSPTALEIVACLSRRGRPAREVAAFVDAAKRAHDALSALATARLGGVRHCTLGDGSGMFDAIAHAFGLAPGPRPIDMADWPPMTADGRVDLGDLAGLIVDGWCAERALRAEQAPGEHRRS